ncbi:preprotein translocase subunit YajC [Steroidobacter flavus]|uniref:Sec translocon accessory complex subunit YajC n=1 Tax=Steroidobacter flavus TaxID=1842136 RepID=A0ABV8T0Q9_9GAMM
MYNAPLFADPGGFGVRAHCAGRHGFAHSFPVFPQFRGHCKMDWLISTAAAQAAGAPGQPSALMQFLPLVLIFVVFYFLLIRPQTKRAKEHRAMVAALGVGAEVVTSGGILGKIVEVSEQFVTLEIASGVNIKVQRHAVSQELPKGTLKSA